MLKTIHILFLCLLVAALQAQEEVPTYPIDLLTVLDMAGGDNLAHRAIQQKYQVAIEQQNASKNWWLPELYGGLQLHQLNGAAMNDDGRFFTNVNRQNVWGGVGFVLDLDLANGIFQNQATQAKTQTQIYQNEVDKNNMMLQAAQLYFELQAAQFKIAALQEMAEHAGDFVKQLELEHEAGLVYQSEVLLASSNWQHYEIQERKSQIELLKASLQLKTLLNINEKGVLLVQDDIIPVDLIENTSSIQQNIENHPSIKSSNAEQKALQKEQSIYGKGLALPNVRLGIEDGIFGDVFSPTGISFQEIDPLYNTFSFTGSVMWSVPLAEILGNGQKDILDAQLALHQIESQLLKDQITCNIEVQRATILATQDQINFASYAVATAKEALGQCLERKEQGTAKLYEVFQAQEIFLKTRLDYIDAVKEFNQAQYAFYVALGNGLD